MVKDRRKWSAFKDEKDVSQAQRTQDLQKIAREAAPGEETTIPKPWVPKWMKEKQEFEAEEAKHHAEAAFEAANNNNKEDHLAPAARRKKNLNLCLLGPPNAGKSTLAGHLIHRFGQLTKTQLIALEKKAMQVGKGSRKFAWSVDRTKEERQCDSTMIVTRHGIEIERYSCCIIDVPSHRRFIKSAIRGISQADAVLLVLPATDLEFDVAMCKDSILHDHLFAALAFGIKQIVVAMTKMDLCDYNQEWFEIQREKVLRYLIDIIGFQLEGVEIVPIVATVGDNLYPSEPKNKRFQKALLEHNENMQWWNQETLIELLDELVAPPNEHVTNLPIVTYSAQQLSSPSSLRLNSPASKMEDEESEDEKSGEDDEEGEAEDEGVEHEKGEERERDDDERGKGKTAEGKERKEDQAEEEDGKTRDDELDVAAISTAATARSSLKGFQTILQKKFDDCMYKIQNLKTDDCMKRIKDLKKIGEGKVKGNIHNRERAAAGGDEEGGKEGKKGEEGEVEVEGEILGGSVSPTTLPPSPSSTFRKKSSLKINIKEKSTSTKNRRNGGMRKGPALRMPVSAVYQVSGIGTVAVGRIVSGSIGLNEWLRVVPGPLDYMNVLADDDHDATIEVPEEETEEELEARLSLGEVVKVKSIQLWKQTLARHSHVKMGSYVGVRIVSLNSKVGVRKGQKTVPLVRPGAVLGSFGLDQSPCRTVKEFSASIVLYNLPCGNSGLSLGISVGWAPIVHVHTANVQCRVVEVVHTHARGKDDRIPPEVDPLLSLARQQDSRASRRKNKGKRKGKERGAHEVNGDSNQYSDDLEEDDTSKKQQIMMKTGDSAKVRFVPFRPLVVEPFDICPALARFVLRDSGRVVGCGLVKSVKYGMHHGSHEVDDESSSSEEDDGDASDLGEEEEENEHDGDDVERKNGEDPEN